MLQQNGMDAGAMNDLALFEMLAMNYSAIFGGMCIKFGTDLSYRKATS